MSSANETRLLATAVVSMTTVESDVIGNVSAAADGGGRHPSPLGALQSLHYSLPGMVAVGGVLLVVMTTTALGNLLVVLSLVRYRSLQTVSNYLIGNLAASDFLLATTVLPLSTVDECLGRWVLGRAMCNAWLLADVLYCTASIWNLLVIAFDRYTATLFPLWYRERRSAKQAAVYVGLVWAVALATCVPPLLGWNNLSDNYVYHNETASYHCVLFQTPSYVIYSASVSFYVPFLLTFFLYVRIFVVLRKRIRRMRETAEVRRSARSAVRPLGEAASPSDLGRGLELTQRPLVVAAGKSRCSVMRSAEISSLHHGYASNIDESTSRSPMSSDSDELDDLESCTITTLHSPSTTALPSPSTPGPSTPTLFATPSNPIVLATPSTANNPFAALTTPVSTTPLSSAPLQSSPLLPLLTPSTSTPRPATSSPSSDPLLLTPSSIQSRQFYLEVTADREGDPHLQTTQHHPRSLDDPESRTKMDLLSPSVCEFDQRWKAKSCHHLQVDHRRTRPSSSGRKKTTNSSTARILSNGTRPPSSPSSAAAATRGGGGRRAGGRYERREMRATVRMSAIIGVFCGMWIGFFTVYVIKGLWGGGGAGGGAGDCLVPRPLEAFFFWMGYSNSAINPVLYTIFNDEFRKAFLKILGCYPKKVVSKHQQRH